MIDKLEKVDLKQIKNYIIWLIILVLIFSFIPLLIYSIKFKDYEISNTPSDWSEFSTFLSGTTGILLSFFALILALFSLFITAIIAKSIHTKDFEYNLKQKELELRITHSQNKPYPFLDLTNYPNKTSIVLQNMGLGTLIVSKITIRYNSNEEFKSFSDLFSKKLKSNSSAGLKINVNTSPNHVLGPNAKKSLLNIKSSTSENEKPEIEHKKYRDLLMACEIIMECNDIFENKFEYNKELSFLR